MPMTKEEKKEYMKEYRKKNKKRIAEKKREYDKQYREKNKERLLEKQREHYEKNKEKKAEYDKQYAKKNKNKKAEYKKEYNQSPVGKKRNTIQVWKQRGLICEDYDSLYAHYLIATHCEECKREFGEIGDGSGTFKCLDHNHDTGLFRNFLCCACNVKRG